MNRFTSLLIIAAFGALVVAPAAAQKNVAAQSMLEAAKQKETLEGDLAGAIKQYQAIVERYSKTDRGVAAQALVHMAGCYLKLGNAEAQKIYARIVKDFADQPEAVTVARAHLAGSNTDTRQTTTRVWSGPRVFAEGTISPDGRYLSGTDWDTGDLQIHDLITGADRRLTNKGTWAQSSDFAVGSAISRDGKQVAYTWYREATSRHELRLVTLEAAGHSTPKTLFANADDRWIGPYDWSPDDKWLAVQLTRKEGPSQIGLLAVSDGTLKILGSHSTTKMSFSPDGTLVAYDRIVPGTSAQRDVFLMSLDGTRDVAVAAHPADDTVMGWAPDGTALLFASDRSGSRALWSLPIANGKPAGPPALIKSDLGPKAVSLGVTRSGGLVYSIQTSAQNIQTAEIDFATGKILSPSTQAVEGYSLYNLDPDWSRDGKSLVYVSERAHGERALSILSQENGRVRELRPRMSYRRPRWAPDGSITIQVSDRPQGIYRVDAQSGDVSPIVVSGPDVTSDLPAWSPDGTLLVYRRRGAGENVVVVREVASGRERVLVRGRALSGVNMSPDGQGVSYIEYDAATKSSTLNVIPVQGGASRELFRAADPVRVGNLVEWTPDGRRLVFGKSENGRVNVSLWIVSSTGGTPTKLELDPKSTVINLRIHPDGRHVAFLTGSGNSLEVWTLEHFLPAATTAKK